MRFDVRKIALLLFLIAPAVQAQLWSGPAAVEVRVEDQKGPAVAGARLALQYNALNPKDGPPAVLTDARGKATVGGLAEGSWHLEVSHEGYMTYLAEITVREKGRLVVEEAAQFNVVGATRTMRVQISKGRSLPVSRAPVAEVPAAPSPAPSGPLAPRSENPPVPAPAPPRDEPATTPAPAIPQEAVPAPAPEPSQAKPTTPPEPPPVQPPQTAPPAPAPEPEKPATPEPPPAKPMTPPTPAPAPEPAPPAPAPQPVIRPAPAPPAPPPADPVRLRTSKDRTCVECPPGESAMSTEWVAPPGGGSGCGDLAAQLQGGQVPGGLPAGCHVLRVALPAGTRYTGYRYEVQTAGDSLDCLAGQSCPQGTGRWPINPVLVRNPDGTVILAPFEAGPAGGERRAVFTVYFTTGTAKRPRQ